MTGLRTGLIGEKVGVTRIFDENGTHIQVTLVKVKGNQVVSTMQYENGKTAVQIGFGEKKQSRLTKPLKGHFAKNKVEPKHYLKEFEVSNDNILKIGDEIAPQHFVVGQKVDVAGKSIGKGFAGGMKRHNFSGLEATHGISVSHRSLGSTGQCQEPGRVFKGKKMAGQMGNKRITKQNLKIVAIDEQEGLIAIKGSIPGAKGAIVEITDAIKAKQNKKLPFPAALINANADGGEANNSKENTQN